MDFVWVLTGAYTDAHSGENKNYALIEYSQSECSLRLSSIRNSCVPWTRHNMDDLPNHLRRELQKNLENGVLYLCHAGSYQFGTFGYMELTGYHIFNEIESDQIRNKLGELLMDECLL